MKKSLHGIFMLFGWKFMKIYILISIIICSLTTFSLAENVYAQEVLDKPITLKVDKAKLIDALHAISKQVDVKFAFAGYDVGNAGTVSLNVRNEKLKNVLGRLFKPVSLDYVIVDNTIIINPAVKKTNVPPINITGKVTDETGLALPGVNILLKGTDKRTSTNADGQFQINIPDRTAVLVFTFIGYKPQEVAVGSATTLDVKMTSVPNALNEVVVVGYGGVSKKDITGAVGQVSMPDLQKAPVVSFDQALAGRVAGVQVSSTDGQPGSAISITIRGPNSLTQDNSPLYVVDGFPMENNNNNAINPADIESINILKDASATAIYGARGANGVIIITTKRGNQGNPVINYNGSYGIQKVTKKMPLLSPYEFVKLQLEIDPILGAANYLSPDTTLDTYKNIAGIDWNSRIFQTSIMENHNLSISGGTAKSRYSISGSYINQNGVIINSGIKRYQGRVTLDQTVSDKFKVGLTANYGDVNSYGTVVNANGGYTTTSFMYNVWAYRPVQNVVSNVDISEALFDPTVSLTDIYRVNPLIQAENELRKALSNSFYVNGYAEYAFTPNLKLRVTEGMNKSNGRNLSFNNSLTRSGSPDNPLGLGINGSTLSSEVYDYSNENTLTYTKSFNKYHNLNVLALYSTQKDKSSLYGASAIQLPNESLGLSGLDEGVPSTIQAGSSEWLLQSFMARINYSYKSKYLLTLSMRADGSSKFAVGHRWGYFPSGALAYRISDESFMKSFKKVISDAKIRVSYGATGNNRVGDFAAYSKIFFAPAYGASFGNAVPKPGAVPSNLANADLKWETTRQFNIGLDLSLLQNRITFIGDYYKKTTSDLLLNATLPQLTGYDAAFKNIGKVSNSGIELSLTTINLAPASKFQWSSSFNISFNRNKVLALTQGQQVLSSTVSSVFATNPSYIAKIGHPIAQFYGLLFDGLYQYSDFDKLSNGTYVLKASVPTNGTNRATIQPGYIKYKDLNHDGVINTSDLTIVGDPNPDFIGGFNNNFQYKGFDLSVFLQFTEGNQIINANRVTFEGRAIYPANTNMFATYADRWSPTNTNTTIPVRGGYGANYLASNIVEDGSFIRLKTISLGYSLPTNLLKHVNVKSARIYVSTQNLYTWTKYSGLDPEVSVRDGALTPGFDYSPYPRAFTMVFGFNLTL
jgi:TonB-linked SusC/RagA family outer membrane protein